MKRSIPVVDSIIIDKPDKPERPEKPETVFGKGYADAYDLLYTDKNYEAECDLIEEVFRRYGGGPIKTILDLGCGTGNHAIPLAQRGYQVTGVDVSFHILVHARSKAYTMSHASLCFRGDEVIQPGQQRRPDWPY